MLLMDNTLKEMINGKKALLYGDLTPVEVFMDLGGDLINDFGGDFEPLNMWSDIAYEAGHSDELIIKYLAYILYGSLDCLTMNRAALYVEKPKAEFGPYDLLVKPTRLGGCRVATRRDVIKLLNIYINDKRNY